MRSKYTFLLSLLGASLFTAQSLSAQVIRTFAGNGTGAGTGMGTYTGDGGDALSAGFNAPSAVSFDGAGNIYVADKANNVIRKVSYSGVVSTFAGTGVAGFTNDSAAATASKLNQPYSIISDMPGNVYIADYANNKVRKVGINGVMRTIAGTGVAGYSGDGFAATAARLDRPQGIAIDQYGNVYVSEAGNHTVRKITPGGIITTLAGNGTNGYSGDGGNGAAAQLYGPAGLTVDVYDNVYIADYFNNVVRKVSAAGVISTYAGNHTQGNTGDGGPATNATMYFPSGVAIYGHGDVYISDQGNNNIRKVDEMGIITHVAGTSTNGYNGDNGPASSAQLSSPKGLSVDGVGRVYVSDYDNNVIRIIKDITAVNNVNNATAINVYPNPATGVITVALPEAGAATITVMDMTGRVVAAQTTGKTAKQTTIDLGNQPAGMYIIRAVSGAKVFVGQVTKNP